jgi:hypothetical protein
MIRRDEMSKEITQFERERVLYNIASLLSDAMSRADDILEIDLKLDILDVRRNVSAKLDDIVLKRAELKKMIDTKLMPG